VNPLILVILIALSGTLAIYGKYAEPESIHYVFKPLTMILIITLAIFRDLNGTSSYKYLIISALFVSLVGDILLMKPIDQFVKGLFAFLAAHIIYIFAFIQHVDAFQYLVWVPFLTFAVIIYSILYKKLERMRIPVLIYVIIISTMGWVAFNRYLNFLDYKNLFILAGGLLFLFSDSIHAINRFLKQFKAAEVLILGTYFSAQLLFALSI
jgi:uncharacterized membrane protein YhhN